MKKFLYMFVFLSVALAACGPAAPTASPTPIETPTISTASTPVPTAAATLGPTPSLPPEGYGPSNFPSDVDPLTGLKVANPALLDRRPMVIKVSNLPRNAVRPQWGLSLADLVYEYFTDDGGTRFAAVFYGNDADMVGPIRSGRLIDIHLVRGYKAIFAFVSADVAVWDQFLDSEFADRLVSEGSNSPIKRYDPNGFNHAVVNTADLSAYATSKGIQDGQQSLDGMFFRLEAPAGGQPGTQAIVRYSSSIYNRWDYDPTTGKYLRFSDMLDDFDVQNEQYVQLTDRLTNQPIAFDNMAVLFVTHEVYSTDSHGNKITDILFSGSGDAYAFRDGQVYQIKWQRNDTDVVSLTNPDGTPFPFKPGTTWFEVVGINSTVQQTDQGWRFTHQMP